MWPDAGACLWGSPKVLTHPSSFPPTTTVAFPSFLLQFLSLNWSPPPFLSPSLHQYHDWHLWSHHWTPCWPSGKQHSQSFLFIFLCPSRISLMSHQYPTSTTHFLSRLIHVNLFHASRNHCCASFTFLSRWVLSNLPSRSLIPSTFLFLAFYPFS